MKHKYMYIILKKLKVLQIMIDGGIAFITSAI